MLFNVRMIALHTIASLVYIISYCCCFALLSYIDFCDIYKYINLHNYAVITNIFLLLWCYYNDCFLNSLGARTVSPILCIVRLA